MIKYNKFNIGIASNRYSALFRQKHAGQVWGKWTILDEPVIYDSSGNKRCTCKCECGNESVVLIEHLFSGHSQSCGCSNNHVYGSKYTKDRRTE